MWQSVFGTAVTETIKIFNVAILSNSWIRRKFKAEIFLQLYQKKDKKKQTNETVALSKQLIRKHSH